MYPNYDPAKRYQSRQTNFTLAQNTSTLIVSSNPKRVYLAVYPANISGVIYVGLKPMTANNQGAEYTSNITPQMLPGYMHPDLVQREWYAWCNNTTSVLIVFEVEELD